MTLLIGVFVVSAAIAACYRLVFVFIAQPWFAQGFHGDSSIHYVIIKHLKQKSRSKFIDQYLISPEPMSYPLAFHRIAALFPLELIRRRSYLPNLLIFSVGSGLFLTILAYLQNEYLPGTSPLLIAGGGLFFFLTPSNIVFDGPAIAYLKLSERLLGRMSCSFYFLGLTLWLIWPQPAWLALAIAAGVVSFTGSIFARQAIVFTTIPLSLILFDPIPVFTLLAAVVLAVLISGDHLVRGIRHTIIQWRLFSTLTKRSGFVKPALSSYWTWRKLHEIRGGLRKTIQLIVQYEPTRALVYYPEIWIGAALAAYGCWPREGAFPLAATVVSSLLVYLLTSTDRFNHLGEAYRYIEYNLTFVGPLALALCCFSPNGGAVSDSMRLAFVACGVFAGHALLFYGLKKAVAKPSRWPNYDRLATFLEPLKLDRQAVVFPVSMQLAANICARTEAKSFWWQPGIISAGIYEEFIEDIPYLKQAYGPLFHKYGVTHVVYEKACVREAPWTYDFSQFELLRQDEHYAAYRVQRAAA